MPGAAYDEGEAEERTSKRTRRSCDRCTAKKVRCDGAPACSNCTLRGYQCHYSEKKRTGPKIKTALDENPELATVMKGGLVPWVGPDRPPSSASMAMPQVAAAAPATTTPSMATFAPNVFSDAPFSSLLTPVEVEHLEVFFAHFNNFLPLTEEGMVRASILRFRAGGCLPVQTLMPQSRVLAPDTAASVEEVQLQNAQNAILWAGVAIGAMMQGDSSVDKYASLAWLSMKECFDYQSVTTVAAYLVMSVLYHFLGETMRMLRYIGLAEEMSKGLEEPVPVDMSVALLFVKAGITYTYERAEQMYRQLRTMPEPSDVPHLRALHLLTRCKTAVIYNKMLNENNRAKGLPRVDLNFTSFMDELQMADVILTEEEGAEGVSLSHYGVCYTRGFLGVMTFLWHGDLDEAISIMLPCLDAVNQLPGIQRMHPCWHFMHNFGIMLMAAGQLDRYELLQHSQARIQCRGDENPVLPALGVRSALEPFCSHPLCQLVQRHVAERVKERQQAPAIEWASREMMMMRYGQGDAGPPPLLVPPAPHASTGVDGPEAALLEPPVEELDFLGELSVEQIEELLLEQPAGEVHFVNVC